MRPSSTHARPTYYSPCSALSVPTFFMHILPSACMRPPHDTPVLAACPSQVYAHLAHCAPRFTQWRAWRGPHCESLPECLFQPRAQPDPQPDPKRTAPQLSAAQLSVQRGGQQLSVQHSAQQEGRPLGAQLGARPGSQPSPNDVSNAGAPAQSPAVLRCVPELKPLK